MEFNSISNEIIALVYIIVFGEMDLILLILVGIIFYILIKRGTSVKENLRLAGSYDLRGDVPIPFMGGISPWNVTSNLPKTRRRMCMGVNCTDELDFPALMSNRGNLVNQMGYPILW